MIDFNAKLGHWPYRPVKGMDALLSMMDSLGIELAAVSSLNAVHYMNPQDGNEEVAAWVAPHRDRLMPFAVVKPGFALWHEDLECCLSEYGMRGVVLHPNYHRSALDDPGMARLMEIAVAHAAPVCIQTCLEDVRRQYGREIIPEVPAPAIGQLASAYPANTIVALGLKAGQIGLLGNPPPRNLYFDLSNVESMGEIEQAVREHPVERMVFGTCFPMFNMNANVDKMAKANIPEDVRLAIIQGNAARLLGL